jgi:hypothetical protein
MKEELQKKLWLVLIVGIVSAAAVIIVALIVVAGPFAERLAEVIFSGQEPNRFLVSFDGSFDGANGEEGWVDGVSLVRGHSGQAALFDDEGTLSYFSEGIIRPEQGAIAFWLQPQWDGDDGQSYVFFEIGDAWFNRFRLIKDGANNFRFMAWSSEVEYDAACNVGHWEADEWHQVRATWGDEALSLYLDGALCDTQTFVTLPEYLDARFHIGSSAQGDMQAQAVIDEFAVYAQP